MNQSSNIHFAHLYSAGTRKTRTNDTMPMRSRLSLLLVETLVFGQLLSPFPVRAQAPNAPAVTPIQHLLVIFQENISFDHYFGTYPFALNPPGEPAFEAVSGTPGINGLSGGLMTNNPNTSSV